MKAKEKTLPTRKTSGVKKPVSVAAAITRPTSTKKSVTALSEKMAQLPSAKSVTPEVTTIAPTQMRRPAPWLIGAWVLVIALALFHFRGQFIPAVVNGQPIFRSTLVRELEQQSGKQVLDNIILKTLVVQEASKQKITVTPKEVDDEIKKLEDTLKNRGQDLDSTLLAQGMSRADLKEQMMLQKLVEKMVSKDVQVSDDEVKQYMETNKAMLPKDAKPEELKAEIKTQLEQQKQSAKIQEWVTNLKSSAKIQHWLFQ